MDTLIDYKEYLQDNIWTHPDSYSGHSPDGNYMIYSQNRDSQTVEISNYRTILKDLQSKAIQLNCDESVYDFRAGHWACGWVEYIIVKIDAPKELLIYCAEIICALADYPVWNESDLSELEWDTASKYWESLSLDEKVGLCKEHNISIFAARHDYLPEEDNGSLFDSLIGY
jgi:hypothetical protein